MQRPPFSRHSDRKTEVLSRLWDVQSDYASSPARVSRSFSSSVMMSRPVQPSSLGRQPSSIGRVRQRKETKYSATLNVYHPSILTIKDFKKHREKGVRMSPSYPPSQSVFGNFSFYSYKKACGQKKTVRGSKNSRRLSNGTPAI